MSKLGALIVLDAILGRPIDVDSIPMQDAPKGVTPGGPGATIDLAAAGVSRDVIRAAQAQAAGGGAGRGRGRGTRLEELEEQDEVDEDELQERERALAELMGGGAPVRPLGVDNAQGEAPSEERDTREGQERETFRLSETGGFLRGY